MSTDRIINYINEKTSLSDKRYYVSLLYFAKYYIKELNIQYFFNRGYDVSKLENYWLKILNEKSQSFERGRIIEQKKVLISKDQLSKTISQNKSSSTPKKVDLIVVALEATNAVANSITSKNEIEAYEIKIDVNNKIYTAYIDYEFSIGTMVSFIVNADNSISNIQSKYLTK